MLRQGKEWFEKKIMRKSFCFLDAKDAMEDLRDIGFISDEHFEIIEFELMRIHHLICQYKEEKFCKLFGIEQNENLFDEEDND